MIIKYEGKDYELGEITNIGDLEKAIKNAQFKKIVALGYLIQQKYHNDIRNMLP